MFATHLCLCEALWANPGTPQFTTAVKLLLLLAKGNIFAPLNSLAKLLLTVFGTKICTTVGTQHIKNKTACFLSYKPLNLAAGLSL